MVGALLMKRAVAKGYAAVDRQDLDAIADQFHEDAVFEFPGQTMMSGRYEGRPAIRAWFERWFAAMPETRFALRHVSVVNPFAVTASNVVHAEWDLDEVDREGHRYHITGVTTWVVERGKGASGQGPHLRPTPPGIDLAARGGRRHRYRGRGLSHHRSGPARYASQDRHGCHSRFIGSTPARHEQPPASVPG